MRQKSIHLNGHSHKRALPPESYRVHNGAQYDLVGAALQDDLNVSLQKSGFGEEFGFCCKWLCKLRTIRFPLECGTLGRRKRHMNAGIIMPLSIGLLKAVLKYILDLVLYWISQQSTSASRRFLCAHVLLIPSVFSVKYHYPLLTDVTLRYLLSVLSFQCGRTADRYKHNRRRQAFEPRDKEHLEMDEVYVSGRWEKISY